LRASRIAGRALDCKQLPAGFVGAAMFQSCAAGDFATGLTVNVDGGQAMHLISFPGDSAA
jgi:hypothetical protein